MQVDRGGKRRIRPDEAPLPSRNKFGSSRVPETLIYDYPEQVYIYKYKSGRNIESIMVKKMGDRTIRQEGTSVDRVISQEEYDALEPLNGPNRFGRFDDDGYGPIQRRDFVMDQALMSAAQSGFSDAVDLTNLAQTNQTVAKRVLENESLLSVLQAIDILKAAVKENNMYIFKLALDANIIGKQDEDEKPEVFEFVLRNCIDYDFDPPSYKGVRESVQILMTHPSTRQFHNKPDLDLSRVYSTCAKKNFFANLRYIFQYVKNPLYLSSALYQTSQMINKEDEIDFLVNNGAPIVYDFWINYSLYRGDDLRHRSTVSIVYNLIKNYDRKSYALISHCLRGRSKKERLEFLEAYHPDFKCPIIAALLYERWDIVRFLLAECKRRYGFTSDELREYRGANDNSHVNFLEEYRYMILTAAIHFFIREKNITREAPTEIVLEILDSILSQFDRLTVQRVNMFGSLTDTRLGYSHPLFQCALRKEGSEIIATKLFSLGVNPVHLELNDRIWSPFLYSLKFTPNIKLIEAYCTFDFTENNWVGLRGDEYNHRVYVRGKLDVNKTRSSNRKTENNIKYYATPLTSAMQNTTPARNNIIKYLIEHKFIHLNSINAKLSTGFVSTNADDVYKESTATELDVAYYGEEGDAQEYTTNVEFQKKRRLEDTDMFMYLIKHGARFTNYISVALYVLRSLIHELRDVSTGQTAYHIADDVEFGPFDFIYTRSTKKTQDKMMWAICRAIFDFGDLKLVLFEHMIEKYKFDINYFEEDNRDRRLLVKDSEGYVDEFDATQPLLNYVLANIDEYDREGNNAMILVQELLDEGASTRIKTYTQNEMQERIINPELNVEKRDALDLAKSYRLVIAQLLTDDASYADKFVQANALEELIRMHRNKNP